MGEFDPQRHQRHSIRLKGYDYSKAGAYFVTMAAFQRERLFGKIEEGEMKLNAFGKIADGCWQAIPRHFQDAELGAHIVMPNHIHGIIIIHDMEDVRRGMPRPNPLSNSHPARTARHRIRWAPSSDRSNRP